MLVTDVEGRGKKEEGRRKREEGRGEREGGKKSEGRRPIGRSANLNFRDRPQKLSIPP